MAAIDSIFGSINEKYTRYEPDLPVGPEWRMRRRYMADEAKVNSLRRFLEDSGPEAANALQRFKVPQTGR